WQELAEDHPVDARGRSGLQAARGGGAGGTPGQPQHEDRSRGAGAAGIPRAPLEAGSAVRVDPVVHGLSRPAQRVLRHLLRQEDDGQAAGLGQRGLRQGAGSRARHPRSEETARALQEGRGDHAGGRGLRAGGVDRAREAAQGTAKAIAEAGGEAVELGVDVTDERGCALMVQTTLDRFGRLTTLVNSAGVSGTRRDATPPPEEWTRVLDVNLSGTYLA